jgi:HK97 family phage portal protein
VKLLERLFGRKSYSIVDLAKDYGLSALVKSGVRVGRVQALQLSTVFGCLRVLGEGIAQVPLKLMRKQGRNLDSATDHDLYDILAHQPNSWMTSFELRELMVWHAALCGAAHIFIVRGTGGSILELIPLQPGSVTVTQASDYSLQYTVTAPGGATKPFPAESIWTVRGPSWNGFEGLEVLKLAREAIGLSLAAEEHHARVHSNSAAPSGLYSVEGQLTKDQYESLRGWLEREYTGLQNLARPMILDRNAKFTPYAFKGVDLQHLETRKFQIEDVCRFFRVMPIMVGYSDKAATYASAEQMFLAHLVHTLMPWYSRIEQSANANLLSRRERKSGLYVKFHERGLLRGAMKDEAEYLSKLVQLGVLTRNEARELMERNPLDDLDLPLTPINLTANLNPVDPPQGNANA